MRRSILLPSLSRARELSKRLVCASNIKGIGTSAKIYANDNDDKWPVPPFSNQDIGDPGVNYLKSDGGEPLDCLPGAGHDRQPALLDDRRALRGGPGDQLVTGPAVIGIALAQLAVDIDPGASDDEVAVGLLDDHTAASQRSGHRLGALALAVDQRSVEVEQHRFEGFRHQR